MVQRTATATAELQGLFGLNPTPAAWSTYGAMAGATSPGSSWDDATYIDVVYGGAPLLFVAAALVLIVAIICCVLAVRAAHCLKLCHREGWLPMSGDTKGTVNETQHMPQWAWRVPSAVSYSLLAACVLGPLLWPMSFLPMSKAVLYFYLFYAVFYVMFVLFGLRRIMLQEQEELPVRDAPSSFYYAFIVPNYMEEPEVLECTLANLASHPYAKRCVCRAPLPPLVCPAYPPPLASSTTLCARSVV